MTRRELDAAGIDDPVLRAAYARCRALNAAHGRTYFLATRLLAPSQRPAIHALYGFARWTDDLVDEPAPGATPAELDGALAKITRHLDRGLEAGHDDHPVVAAVVDTTLRYGVDPGLFTAFMASMRMDLQVTDYASRADLMRYVHGSAEVIGLQVLPVLGTVTSQAEAAPHAAALGRAFQLTNFLRDVAEDLDRGRVYLPADELASFGVDRERLLWCRAMGRADKPVRAALGHQAAIARDVYLIARRGIPMLHPVSRPCVETALVLYAEILHRISDLDHDVFAGRARVGGRRRAAVAGRALAGAVWARRGGRAPRAPADNKTVQARVA
ncbi:phytoene/squalene synthase family protein [Actinokineospora sp. NBRC 105648]|uniref:phytoene/squalene synthase family protein n=1 Tax=Actinokineospora sp. NBRC 105648 TaxID=3032206 RepID=UPI0024A378C1|nr:phytoene/squalene synthase family protein [Actinokineospora sp. NBRC 105648]GLZ40535.1 phytoene synthase [Actinokineospora sp. NBRC 105648]